MSSPQWSSNPTPFFQAYLYFMPYRGPFLVAPAVPPAWSQNQPPCHLHHPPFKMVGYCHGLWCLFTPSSSRAQGFFSMSFLRCLLQQKCSTAWKMGMQSQPTFELLAISIAQHLLPSTRKDGLCLLQISHLY